MSKKYKKMVKSLEKELKHLKKKEKRLECSIEQKHCLPICPQPVRTQLGSIIPGPPVINSSGPVNPVTPITPVRPIPHKKTCKRKRGNESNINIILNGMGHTSSTTTSTLTSSTPSTNLTTTPITSLPVTLSTAVAVISQSLNTGSYNQGFYHNTATSVVGSNQDPIIDNNTNLTNLITIVNNSNYRFGPFTGKTSISLHGQYGITTPNITGLTISGTLRIYAVPVNNTNAATLAAQVNSTSNNATITSGNLHNQLTFGSSSSPITASLSGLINTTAYYLVPVLVLTLTNNNSNVNTPSFVSGSITLS